MQGILLLTGDLMQTEMTLFSDVFDAQMNAHFLVQMMSLMNCGPSDIGFMEMAQSDHWQLTSHTHIT